MGESVMTTPPDTTPINGELLEALKPFAQLVQRTLDTARRAIDALGGRYPRGDDYQRGVADGYNEALELARKEIEKLGGKPS